MKRKQVEQTFDAFWTDCCKLSRTQRQLEIMGKLKNLYYDAWEEGRSAEEFMEDEWG